MADTDTSSRAGGPDADALTQMLEAHDDPAVLIDDHYTIVAANRAYVRSYAQPGDDLRGHKCHRVSHHSDVPCHQRGEDCPVRRVMRDGQPVDTLHIHFHEDATPERVRVRGFPVQLGPRRLLLERIHRLQADEPAGPATVEELQGNSPALLTSMQRLLQAAALPGSVLIRGETGVGKELAARFVHAQSACVGGPFVTADCTAIPEPLFESELFGHERGAFTGSSRRHAGLFESAHEGTLFLDEIGELPLAVQAKLLRAIERGEFRRLGATRTEQARVRIVAATNRDLRAMVADGQFRLDLYYRLATHEIVLPALRERIEDLPLLCRHLLARFDRHPSPSLTQGALNRLAAHDWPGNIRELRNVLERALGGGPVIDSAAIDAALGDHDVASPGASATRPDSGMSTHSHGALDDPRISRAGTPELTVPPPGVLDRARRDLLITHLARLGGHRGRVAQAMGVSERTVYRWIRRFGLEDSTDSDAGSGSAL